MNPIKTDQVVKTSITDWLKDHWRWILIGLILAGGLWAAGQYVAAIGSAFTAVWKWLFYKGKEVATQRKIDRVEAKRVKARDNMVKAVTDATVEASAEDAKLDAQGQARGQPTGDPAKDKDKMLNMLDQLDDMDSGGKGRGNSG